jgi:hypothetical protein
MTWFAFQGSGSVYNLNGLTEKELVFTGAHGYATEAEAKAHPNGPANPEQAILLAEDQAAASLPVGGGQAGVQSGTTQAVGITSYLDAIKKAAAWISNRGNMVRIVKVVAGGGMILVGISMLVKDTNTVQGAISTATKVVK